MARHMPPAGGDEPLAFGYLFVLQLLLEHLRHRADSGYADAIKLIADFQGHVIAQVDAGHADGRLLALVGRALHQSRIPASPDFVATTAQHGIDARDDAPPADIGIAIGQIFEACGGDPFMAVGALFQSGHALPAEARGAFARELAHAGIPDARGAVVLLLLDPDPAVRREAAGALGEVAAALRAADVRRLIAMRNWRPESERAQVDAVIRKARSAGIECAQWEAGGAEDIIGTALDGGGAQVFMLVSPAGRKKRLSSILTKDGIEDGGCHEPQSSRKVEANLAGMGAGTSTLTVSRSYLDRTLAHHLALTVEKGRVPPAGLLHVAEAIGGADWQPARFEFKDALAGLLTEVPRRMREPAALASILRDTGKRPDLRAVALSWYEDDPEVVQAIEDAHVRRDRLADYLLQGVVGRRRGKWAEVVLRTALWMREGPPEVHLPWREAALIAKALADGRDMTEIGLMREIAVRTITALRDKGRV
jgi:hypothetical protein